MGKYTKAWLVRLDFNDHCSHDGAQGGAIPITLFGILRSMDKDAYHVSTWVADGDPYDHNSDCYSILRKGTKLTKIKQITVGEK